MAKDKTKRTSRRKPAAAPREDGDEGQAPLGAELLMPAKTVVTALAVDHDKAQKTSRSAMGAFGQKMGQMVDEKHVDRKAYGMAKALRDMPDEKLAITLPHLLLYINFFGLTERARKQAELFEETAEPSKDKTGGNPAGRSDAEGTGNVHHIGAAARKVTEQAGAAFGA